MLVTTPIWLSLSSYDARLWFGNGRLDRTAAHHRPFKLGVGRRIQQSQLTCNVTDSWSDCKALCSNVGYCSAAEVTDRNFTGVARLARACSSSLLWVVFFLATNRRLARSEFCVRSSSKPPKALLHAETNFFAALNSVRLNAVITYISFVSYLLDFDQLQSRWFIFWSANFLPPHPPLSSFFLFVRKFYSTIKDQQTTWTERVWCALFSRQFPWSV